VPDERHVSYGVGAIDLHGLHLLGIVEIPRWRCDGPMSNGYWL
jgi:hypothetical protein